MKILSEKAKSNLPTLSAEIATLLSLKANLLLQTPGGEPTFLDALRYVCEGTLITAVVVGGIIIISRIQAGKNRLGPHEQWIKPEVKPKEEKKTKTEKITPRAILKTPDGREIVNVNVEYPQYDIAAADARISKIKKEIKELEEMVDKLKIGNWQRRDPVHFAKFNDQLRAKNQELVEAVKVKDGERY